MVEWHYFTKSGKKLCKCHMMQICPSYPTAGTHTPSLHMEKDKVKKEVLKDSTKDSRRITKNPRRVIERFHAYRVKFVADVDWVSLFQFPEFELRNNVKFKRIDLPKAIVKVFRKSILITLRSSCDIKGLPVKDAKVCADGFIRETIEQLPKGIVLRGFDVVGLHNAFMGHSYAKKDVNVSIDGVKRFISDNSHGVSEFEAINPTYAISDSEALEEDIVQLVDKGLSRDVLASSIQSLIKDREYYADNLKSHVLAIKELSFAIKRLGRKL